MSFLGFPHHLISSGILVSICSNIFYEVLCVFSAKQTMKFTYISFVGAEKLHFYEDNFWRFCSTGFDILSILPQRAILGFLDVHLEHKLL